MIRLLLLLVLFAFTAQAQTEEEVTTSPRGTFQIVQHHDGNWTQVLRFTGFHPRTIPLEEGISWPALYYVSPDEQWVLRVQKSGSGDNIAFLYHLDEHGQFWRKEEQLGRFGFAFLAAQPGSPRNLYHTGIDFDSWNLQAGQLRFSIHGSDADRSNKGVDRLLVYNLQDGTIATP